MKSKRALTSFRGLSTTLLPITTNAWVGRLCLAYNGSAVLGTLGRALGRTVSSALADPAAGEVVSGRLARPTVHTPAYVPLHSLLNSIPGVRCMLADCSQPRKINIFSHFDTSSLT
ncbi:hypothetical protein BDD12DRAFT_841781 [Trichophaea hybrida]|nr:hypothetical protein BDD12DRAFT_841781 [Trichophaea hybrida]